MGDKSLKSKQKQAGQKHAREQKAEGKKAAEAAIQSARPEPPKKTPAGEASRNGARAKR